MLAIFSTIKNKRNLLRGITLVEAILYLSLLLLIVGVVVNMLLTVNGSYRDIKLTREIESSGTAAMESLLREIRNASSIDTGNSQFGINPGVVALTGVDEDSNPYTKTFDVSGGAIRISENGGTPAVLTSSLGYIDSLIFTRLATSTSEAIRIELEVSGTLGTLSKSEKFYGFVILRGSY